jgi:uncharacterized protein (TIGR03435 family)
MSGSRALLTILFIAGFLLTIICPALLSQTEDSPRKNGSLSFDVASIKRNLSGFPPNGPMPHSNFPLDSDDAYAKVGGLFDATNWPVYSFIGFAYKLRPTELRSAMDQLAKLGITDYFDIQARASGEPSKDEMRLMMQALLAERFKLAVHTETRQMPIYDLELQKPGKTGQNLLPHSDAHPCVATRDASDPAAVPPCGTMTLNLLPGRFYVDARGMTMAAIALYLPASDRNALDRPAIDKTGVPGTFDFTMEWAPLNSFSWNGNVVQPDPSAPTFVEALKDQLGLKLVADTGPLDFLIIDHVEEPSAN